MYPPPEGPTPGVPGATPPRYVALRLPRVTPVVTYVLLVFTIAVFCLQLVTEYAFGQDLAQAFGMKVNELIIAGQLWRLITPMFLHGSIIHILFNMYALFALGPGLESSYGHGRFLGLYLVSGFAGNVISFLFSGNPSLGSSTAIFGLIGAEGVLIYQNREVFGSIARRALTQVVVIAAVNLLIGVTIPGIDIWGHIGGLIGGTLFAWFGGPLLRRQELIQTNAVVNVRNGREVIVAGTAVFALFFFLTIAAIFINKG